MPSYELLNRAAVHFGYFGFGLTLLLAVTDYITREKKHFSYYFFLNALLASIQLRLCLYADGYTGRQPLVIFGFLTAMMAIGPLIYLQGYLMLDLTRPNRRTLVLQWLPAGLVLCYEFIFQFQPLVDRQQVLHDTLMTTNMTVIKATILAGVVSIFVFFVVVVAGYFRWKKKYDLKYTRYMYSIVLSPLIGIALLAWGFVFNNRVAYDTGLIPLTITYVLFFFARSKYPSFFETLKTEIRQAKYENTQLNGINLEAVHSRLEEMMNDRKIFYDENLRLGHLANELLITPHQLSRIFNEHYGKNFNQYINHYRIEEAKRLLIEHPNNSVLSVAFEVGFNTKSSFNSQFLKSTGKTPVAWRKDELARRGHK